MSETLANLLVDLASDPDRLRAFLSDPTSIVEQSALSPSEKEAVLSQDGRMILKAMGLAGGKTAMQMFKGHRPPSKPKSKKTVRKKTGRKKTGSRKK